VDQAVIRLSWRTPPTFVEECRRLTQEELERLPVHMRREEVCERRALPYRLQVQLDGRTILNQAVRPAGARQDRPLYVFHELPVAPGAYEVTVLWGPNTGPTAATLAEGPHAEPASPLGPDMSAPLRAASAREPLALTAKLLLEARDISLITYDLDRQVLVARGRGLTR
jgi:hypothetical protein